MPTAQTDFLRMVQSGFPLRIRVVHMEVLMIRVFMPEGFHMFVQPASRGNWHLVAQVNTGLVQSNRIKGRKHTDIRYDRNIVFRVAVAVRRDITDQRNMECRPPLYNRIGIFCNLLRQDSRRVADAGFNCVFGTDRQTAAAADAFIVVDVGFPVFNRRAAMRADADTGTAADAQCRIRFPYQGF